MKKLVAALCVTAVSTAGAMTFAASTPSITQDMVTWANNNGMTMHQSVSAFNANAPVTREQAAKIITVWIGANQGLDLPMSSAGCTFSDAASIDETLKYNVENACAYGLFKGHKGMFMPKRYITRDDVRTLIMRATDLAPSFKEYANLIPTISSDFLSRGELLKALYSADATVKAKLANDKSEYLTAVQSRLNTAKTLWDNKDADHYTATQQITCFCAPSTTHPIKFEVKNGMVVTGTLEDINDTDKLPASQLSVEPKTVEQLFDLIQDAITRKADSIKIEYDETLGYPTKIDVDYSRLMADEEMYYTYSVSVIR